MLHHLMVGTWTPPGAIFTIEFDDEALTLKLLKRTPIPEDEPISWMTFDVSLDFCLWGVLFASMLIKCFYLHSMREKTYMELQ